MPKFFCITLMVYGLASTVAAGKANPDKVQTLLKKSHAEGTFVQSREAITNALDSRKTYNALPDDQEKAIKETSAKIYGTQNLFGVYAAAFAALAQDADVVQEATLFQTPEGEAYEKALAEMAHPNFPAKSQQYWQTRDVTKLAANRKNVLQSYLKQTKAAEMRGTFWEGIDIGIDLAMNAYLPASSRLALAEIKSRNVARKRTHMAKANEEVFKQYTFAFREMKTEQIDTITKFFYTRAGERNREVALKALELAMDRAGETLMVSLNPEAKPQKARPYQPRKKQVEKPATQKKKGAETKQRPQTKKPQKKKKPTDL